MDGIGRNFGCRDQKMDYSSALESYWFLLSNAPLLAMIRAVLAMIQHEMSASNTTISKVLAKHFPYVSHWYSFDIPFMSL